MQRSTKKKLRTTWDDVGFSVSRVNNDWFFFTIYKRVRENTVGKQMKQDLGRSRSKGTSEKGSPVFLDGISKRKVRVPSLLPVSGLDGRFLVNGTNLSNRVKGFRKAFHSVWHDGLLYKLLQIGVGGCFYKLIKNLYSNSSCALKIGTSQTRSFSYSRGVRQGCILSPLLFNLYVSDLPHFKILYPTLSSFQMGPN